MIIDLYWCAKNQSVGHIQARSSYCISNLIMPLFVSIIIIVPFIISTIIIIKLNTLKIVTSFHEHDEVSRGIFIWYCLSNFTILYNRTNFQFIQNKNTGRTDFLNRSDSIKTSVEHSIICTSHLNFISLFHCDLHEHRFAADKNNLAKMMTGITALLFLCSMSVSLGHQPDGNDYIHSCTPTINLQLVSSIDGLY